MARLFLSFLGTSHYVACRYQMAGVTSAPLQFIQEFTIGHCCRRWTAQDRIVLFTTRAAAEKNWNDNGHGDNLPGLAKRLDAMGLKAGVRRVDIPDGHDERQIWDIFSIVLDQIEQNDEVVFDVTHAFRSIPLLAMVILNYAKVARGIRLIGIYYGAFEVLGTPGEVKQRLPDPMARVAPVLDLTPLDRLLDWGFAVDKLLKAGDATALRALARASVKELLTASQGKDDGASAVRALGDALDIFTKTISTCRSQEIAPASQRLKTALERCDRSSLVNPIKPLIGRMEEAVAPFQGDLVADGIQAARWCAEHHLVQQGITILNETLTTWCLMRSGGTGRITDVKARTVTSQALDIVKRDRPESEWKEDANKEPDLTRQLIQTIRQKPEAAQVASELRELRNDINHGGMNATPFSADHFDKKLKKMIAKMENVVDA